MTVMAVESGRFEAAASCSSAFRQWQCSSSAHHDTMEQLENTDHQNARLTASRYHAPSGRTASSVTDLADFPPNHHGEARHHGGVLGYLAGLTMLVGRGRDARLVMRLTDLTAADRLVDIGCGPGTAVRIAARSGAETTGVDPSGPMLRLARLASKLRRVAGRSRWLQNGAECISLSDASTTICWSLASVHHWPDLRAGIDEARRILEPGGQFIVLEARTRDGASGHASHGWTPAQASRFAQLLKTADFDDVRIADHDLGRRRVVTVVGTKPIRVADE
jgi:ubiquinone/menaquinone biosynthesis C-methylase UbiE